MNLMGEMSKELLDMLTEFTVCEVGSKVVDGITYTLLLKTERDRELVERYKRIKVETANCGYVSNEVFRMYELSNGYIFDMDMRVARAITAQIVRTINREQNNIKNPDLISDAPERRRKKDIIALSKYIIDQFNQGKREIEVALFSKNTTDRIVINGTGPNGEALVISYRAYAIRHWDIELLNEKLLIPQGLRISRIQPFEVLPSKTGVSFLFTLERM